MDLINSPHFEKHITDVLKAFHTPGVAIAILQDGKVESKGFGLASMDPPKPVASDTLFDIASSSKSLTAAAVALLVADNEKYPQVRWDSKMSILLSEDFVMSKDDYTNDVTVEDILCHRTGLPSHQDSILGVRAKQPDSVGSITRNLRNLQVAAPIRTKFMYSNMMFNVASHLVETLSGQTFEQFLHQSFFKPLDMSSTNLQPNASIDAGLKNRMAIPHVWTDDQLKAVPWEQMPDGQGAGSIITSVTDYLKYVQALMNQEKPFTEEILKAVTTPRIITNPEDDIDELDPFTSPTLYALGWEVIYYRGYKVVQHGGQISGSGGGVFFVPALKFAATIFGNSDYASSVAEVVFMEMLDALIDVSVKDRIDWTAHSQKQTQKYKDELVKGDALKKNIWPEFDGETEPQKLPLETYIGQYWNVGYRGMTVEVKDEQLFVDASDRADGFTLRFEHVCKQTMYVAVLRERLGDVDGDSFEMEAEFRIENDRVVKMGVKLEEDLEEMIWFDRVK